jgi:methylenetetrahydrofolate reductase (NADPH)
MIKRMKNEGLFQNGEQILAGKPEVFIGAAANPFAEPVEFRVKRLYKKIIAGAEFIQTQSVYNLDKFYTWLDKVRSQGLDKKIHILAGITPLKSEKMTERMKFHVPGVDIPNFIYKRMKQTDDVKHEGYSIALELIDELKKANGIRGIHITALFWENIIPKLVRESGIYPR